MARSEPLYRPIATDLRHLDDTCVTPARYDEGAAGEVCEPTRGFHTTQPLRAPRARTIATGETPQDTHLGKEKSPW